MRQPITLLVMAKMNPNTLTQDRHFDPVMHNPTVQFGDDQSDISPDRTRDGCVVTNPSAPA
jgi:hypothetical protein